MTIAAILIQKESGESEKGVFPCHVTLAVIAGGSNGKMVTTLLIFFIRLFICKPRGNSLYAMEGVFGNSEDHTGRKRAELISAEGRAVCSGWSTVWALLASLAPTLLPSPSSCLCSARGSLQREAITAQCFGHSVTRSGGRISVDWLDASLEPARPRFPLAVYDRKLEMPVPP